MTSPLQEQPRGDNLVIGGYDLPSFRYVAGGGVAVIHILEMAGSVPVAGGITRSSNAIAQACGWLCRMPSSTPASTVSPYRYTADTFARILRLDLLMQAGLTCSIWWGVRHDYIHDYI